MSANLSYMALFTLKILDVSSRLCVLLHGYFKDDTLLIGRLEWRPCYFKLFYVYLFFSLAGKSFHYGPHSEQHDA